MTTPMPTQRKVTPQEMQEFYDKTKASGLVPGWLGRGDEEKPKTLPFLWRWSDVEPLIHRSGDVVTPDRDVERRILRLANPGLPNGTTHTIMAALQLLLPGESAPLPTGTRPPPSGGYWRATAFTPPSTATSVTWNGAI